MLVSSRGVDPRPRRTQGSSAAQVEVAPRLWRVSFRRRCSLSTILLA
jgi:hypothetical protein